MHISQVILKNTHMEYMYSVQNYNLGYEDYFVNFKNFRKFPQPVAYIISTILIYNPS